MMLIKFILWVAFCFAFIWVVLANVPDTIMYKSVRTQTCASILDNGKEISCDELPNYDRYEVVWVE